MTADQDTFAKMLIQALSEWWAGAGAVAWAVLGVLLLVGVVVSLAKMLLRNEMLAVFHVMPRATSELFVLLRLSS